MEFTPQFWLSLGTIIFTLGGTIAIVKARLDRFERDLEKETEKDIKEKDDIWREMSKLRDWKQEHEIEKSEKRLEIEQRFTELRIAIADTKNGFEAIQKRFEDVLTKLDKIEEKIEHRN